MAMLMSIAGGIAGYISVTNNTIISGDTVKNAVINTESQVTGGMFGYIGDINNDKDIKGCTVDNVTIKNENSLDGIPDRNNGEYNNIVGGIAGYVEGTSTMTVCGVKNSNLSIEQGQGNTAHIGGVVGMSGNDSTMKGTHLENTNIENDTPRGVTGGIMGLTLKQENQQAKEDKKLDITGCTITGDCIKGKLHVGGVLGFGKVSSTGATISDTTIEGLEPEVETDISDVGGIIGNSLPESSITGVTANDLTVKGTTRAGGIAGINKGTITNSNVINSTIETTDVNSQTGGITGHDAPEGSVTCGNAKGCKILSNKGTVGVISGYTNKKETDCDDTGTIAETTGGGIFGITHNGEENVEEPKEPEESGEPEESEDSGSSEG